VFIGILGESAEFIVKWGRKRRFRGWFNDTNRRRLVGFVKVIRPKLLPIETLFFVVLVIGLAIEILGSFAAERLQSKANLELSATNAVILLRVEQLRSNNLVLSIELEKLKHPRTIKPEQKTALIKCLSGCPKGKVFISAGAFDGEATMYAQDIEEVLKSAGFETDRAIFPSPNAPVSLLLPGLHLVVKDLKHPPIYAPPIQRCFSACGITMDGAWGDEAFDSNRVDIAVGQHF